MPLCCTRRAQASISVDTVGPEARLRGVAQSRERPLIRFEINPIAEKKQGAAGITTAAPYVTGQWGRGDNRLLE